MTMVSINKNNRTEIGIYEKAFSIFMALYPLLCIYKGISNLTIGDLILIAFFFVALFKQKTIILDTRTGIILTFVLYAYLVLIINLLFTDVGEIYGTTSLLIRLLKFAFYMACVLICGKNFLNYYVFKKTIFYCSLAACVFLFLQYAVFFDTGKILLGQIPGLSLHLDEYASLDYESLFANNFRPSSFFLEPALFVHYVIVALVFALFDAGTSSKSIRVLLIVVFSMGIVMSTAAQGIVYLIIAFWGYALKGIKNKARSIAFIFLFICVALICFNNIEVLQNAMDRLLNNEDAAEARLGAYRYCFEMSGLKALFGNGYGTTANGEYMAGAAYVWYGCGLIGLAVILALFTASYKKSNNDISKILCVIFLVMFFGTALFYNYMVCWYFTLIMAKFTILGGVILLTVLLRPLLCRHLQKILSLFTPYMRYFVCHSSKKYRRCEI